jgi:hypothetical protein
MTDDLAPSRLVEHTFDGATSLYSLTFDDFGPCADAFEARGFDAGGYSWHGVVETLVKLEAPEIADQIGYDPESSMFAAYGNDRDALLRVAELIREVQTNRELLERVLDNVDLAEYD